MHRHTTPRRPVTKPLLVFGVHLRKIRHVDKEHVHFHHFADRGPARGEDRLQVGDAGPGFVGDAAGDEGAGAVGGDLAGAVELGRRADGLGLWGGGVSRGVGVRG